VGQLLLFSCHTLRGFIYECSNSKICPIYMVSANICAFPSTCVVSTLYLFPGAMFKRSLKEHVTINGQLLLAHNDNIGFTIVHDGRWAVLLQTSRESCVVKENSTPLCRPWKRGSRPEAGAATGSQTQTEAANESAAQQYAVECTGQQYQLLLFVNKKAESSNYNV